MDSVWLFSIVVQLAFCSWSLSRIADALEKRK
jgi:hypothetical protein